MLEWALARGIGVDFDALTVVLAAKSEQDGSVLRWKENDVWRLWWLDLHLWCNRHQVDLPGELSAAMLSLFAHLDAECLFAAGSDRYPDLCEALVEAGAPASPEPTHAPAG